MGRRVTIGVAVFVTALLVTGAASSARHATQTRDESALLSAMNQARAAHGVRPLRADARLTRAARSHSATMLRTGRFFHGAFAARIRRAGVRAPRVGENLAWAVGSLSRARAIVNAWLGSPGHRANLLRPGYSIVGVGALRGTFRGYTNALVVTTDFAGT